MARRALSARFACPGDAWNAANDILKEKFAKVEALAKKLAEQNSGEQNFAEQNSAEQNSAE